MAARELEATIRAVERVLRGSMSITRAASIEGVHRTTVQKACKRAGVEPQPRGRPPGARNKRRAPDGQKPA